MLTRLYRKPSSSLAMHLVRAVLLHSSFDQVTQNKQESTQWINCEFKWEEYIWQPGNMYAPDVTWTITDEDFIVLFPWLNLCILEVICEDVFKTVFNKINLKFPAQCKWLSQATSTRIVEMWHYNCENNGTKNYSLKVVVVVDGGEGQSVFGVFGNLPGITIFNVLMLDHIYHSIQFWQICTWARF